MNMACVPLTQRGRQGRSEQASKAFAGTKFAIFTNFCDSGGWDALEKVKDAPLTAYYVPGTVWGKASSAPGIASIVNQHIL
jgi:hypothetical protein